ncbi:MAG: hypothetical protein HY875_10470 [Chloroflexi bacterium]|nr:hypothetical protein [Chloroflexota bacterium]
MTRRSRALPGLRAYQARALRNLLRAIPKHPGATFTVMFPRQAGKNEVQAWLVALLLRANVHHGGEIVVAAPSYRPQARISLERVRRRLELVEGYFPAAPARIAGNTISAGGASATFLSASPEASVAGHTASLLLVGDEAQDIDAETFDRQFRPMAASTGAPTVLFGTAWDGSSLLEVAAARNRERDLRDAAAGATVVPFHHQVTWEEVALAVPAYGVYVRGERDRLGADHPLFLSQYELVPARGAGCLFGPGPLARMEGTYPVLNRPVEGERYVAGLDLGGEGASADRTVLTVARVDGGRCEVVAHASWQGEAYDVLESAVLALASHWRFERLSADASGLGAPVVSRLRRALGARVEAVVFTGGVKSAMGYSLQAAASTGSLALPMPDDSADAWRCRTELRECRSGLRAGGALWWAAPSGGHDDYVASLALCLRAAESVGPPRVAKGRGMRAEDLGLGT